MNKATLSVVMPNYNHAHYITEALEAILAQSFRPLEVIVIDDGSTDNSVPVIEEFVRRDPIVRLLRNDRNMGVVFSMNRGLERASGDYVFGGAADDKVLPGLFEKSMRLLAEYPKAGICTTLSRLVSEGGKELGVYPLPPWVSRTASFLPPDEVLTALYRVGSWYMGNTAIYRRHALLEAGGFLPELRAYCDGFIFQVIALRHGACFIPEPLAVWNPAESGVSSGARSNVQEFLDCMEQAERLMRSTYSDVFPKRYVQAFRRNNLYTAGWMACRTLRVHQGECLTHLRRSLERSRLIDRLFLTGLQLYMAIQYLGAQFYLLIRLGRPTWRMLGIGFRSALKNLSGKSFRAQDDR